MNIPIAAHPRDPKRLARAPQAAYFPAALAALKVPPAILGKVGEVFATGLSAVQRSLAALPALPPTQQSALAAAQIEIARLEAFGLQVQALSRILAGDAPAPAERVDLRRAAREAIAEWTEAARRHGAILGGPSQPFLLDVNAAAIAQLLDLGIEYGLRLGSRVELDVALEGFTPHPVLAIRIHLAQPNGVIEDAGAEDVHWLLFAELARALGLLPQRRVDGAVLTLTLGFAAVGGAAVASEGGADALTHTATATGRRVLLIDPQETSRVLASRLMSAVGMRVTPARDIDQARACLMDQTPDLLVTGIPLADVRFHSLLDDVRAAQPRLRIVELVDDESAFDFSVPGSDSPARVGRLNMGQTLVRAVSQELDAAWPD